MFRIILSWVAATLVIAPAFADDPVRDRTVGVSGADAEMNAAIRHAQATLDQFLALAANPPRGADGFKLKVRIVDAGRVEHLWVTPFRREGAAFIGTVADDPELVKSVRYGQSYRFGRGDITDWGYEQGGKQKGSFTVCVLFKHMPRAEVEQYRKDYGFEC
jgi:uncharacterized protein YegJ (DUF2314 family)